MSKLIGGVPHMQKRCVKCKQLVWRECSLKEKDEGFFCSTCYQANLQPSTGGGTRVIRSGKEMS